MNSDDGFGMVSPIDEIADLHREIEFLKSELGRGNQMLATLRAEANAARIVKEADAREIARVTAERDELQRSNDLLLADATRLRRELDDERGIVR